jgi:hypothetical protein
MFTFLKLLRNPIADKLQTICEQLNLDSDIEIETFLEKNQYFKNILSGIETYKNTKNYYYGIYKNSNYVLEVLESSEDYINLESLKQLIQDYKTIDDKRNLHILETFLPKTEIPSYDRVSSITGRQKILNGPQILTLKKDDRKKIFSDKNLFLIDFSALEPSFLFQILGFYDLNYEDLYSSIKSNLNLKFIDRAAIKLAVLKILYGSNIDHIKEINHEESIKLEKFLLNDKFLKFKEMLHSDLYEKGQLYNIFGKPLLSRAQVENSDFQPYMLVNYFIQSSAADLSLLLLSDFCKKYANHINPLFVIHDALLFYAKPSFSKEKIMKLKYENYEIFAKITHSNE